MLDQNIFGNKQKKVVKEEPYFLKPINYSNVDYRLKNSTNCWIEKSTTTSTWLCPKINKNQNKKTR